MATVCRSRQLGSSDRVQQTTQCVSRGPTQHDDSTSVLCPSHRLEVQAKQDKRVTLRRHISEYLINIVT